MQAQDGGGGGDNKLNRAESSKTAISEAGSSEPKSGRTTIKISDSDLAGAAAPSKEPEKEKKPEVSAAKQ